MPPSLQDNHFSPIYNNSYPATQNASYDASPNTAWYPSTTANEATNAQTSSSSKSKATPQDTEKLRRLPEVRAIPWRKGKECVPEKSTHSSRPQTRGAFLLVTRGTARQPCCTHCETGAGRFSVCVSLLDWYSGACATCVMATRGNKCSLRQDVEEGLLPADGVQQESTRQESADEEDEDEDQQSSSLKRKRSPNRIYGSEYSPGEPRAPVQNMINTNYVPSYNSGPGQPPNPYLPQAGTYTGSPNTQAPRDLVQPEKNPLMDFVYQKQVPPTNGKKRHQLMRGVERESSQSTNEPINKRVRISDEGEASSSMSPRIPQPLPATNYMPTASNGNVTYTGPEPTPLIDMLSKKKQREIFGILGSLQSGIRLVRQQTNNLQKQLDVLQIALGIELNDQDDDAN